MKGIQEGETPSAWAYSNARGLAKLGAEFMQPDNRVISTKGFEAMHSDPIEAPEYYSGGTTNFTQGGINKYKIPTNPSQNDIYLNGMHQGYYGWKGIGGSIFQWHPELDVSISYVMS